MWEHEFPTSSYINQNSVAYGLENDISAKESRQQAGHRCADVYMCVCVCVRVCVCLYMPVFCWCVYKLVCVHVFVCLEVWVGKACVICDKKYTVQQ